MVNASKWRSSCWSEHCDHQRSSAKAKNSGEAFWQRGNGGRSLPFPLTQRRSDRRPRSFAAARGQRRQKGEDHGETRNFAAYRGHRRDRRRVAVAAHDAGRAGSARRVRNAGRRHAAEKNITPMSTIGRSTTEPGTLTGKTQQLREWKSRCRRRARAITAATARNLPSGHTAAKTPGPRSGGCFVLPRRPAAPLEWPFRSGSACPQSDRRWSCGGIGTRRRSRSWRTPYRCRHPTSAQNASR